MPIDIAEKFKSLGFKHLLLAVSGGLDSICLAHYFISNKERLGVEWLGIAHVHHGLREITADRDAAFVEDFARKFNVPFFLKKLDGEALKAADGSLEENARDARYKALTEIALDSSYPIVLVTAHHAGDQAETVYMRLRRGTTLAGLRGIQEVRVLNGLKIFRPFLNITRAELLDHAREHNLDWCEDESNTEVKFARNKIRHELLPRLEKNIPGATLQLCRIAALADKSFENVFAKCKEVFAPCLLNEKVAEKCAPIPLNSIAIDKKKLNKILLDHSGADLSEMFRLWLSTLGFRFPTGFFYSKDEPSHIKIPVRAVYRKRSILKIRHTVWICEFVNTESAAKFVS